MGKLYDTDMSGAAWTLVAPLLPPAKPGGRPRTTCMRAVLNAVFYLLRSGCQWRLLPRVEGGPISGHLNAMHRRLQPLTVQRPDWL